MLEYEKQKLKDIYKFIIHKYRHNFLLREISNVYVKGARYFNK